MIDEPPFAREVEPMSTNLVVDDDSTMIVVMKADAACRDGGAA